MLGSGRTPTRQGGLGGAAPRVFRPPWWVRARSGDMTWYVRSDWEQALLGDEGLRLEEWRAHGRLSVVKQGPHRAVYRADLPAGSVYIKHYLIPDFRAMLRQWFRRGKGRNEGKRAAKLEAIGIPTINPIALGEQRKGKFLFENYLITEAIVDTLPLDEFVERRLPALPEPQRGRIRRALAEAMGELTARLHQAGFVHIDFHPGNLLVRFDETGHPRLAMVDLDALRVRKRLTWRDARANLALLNHYFWLRSARSDRLRFLSAYFRARGLTPKDLTGFARGIESDTRSWAERLWTRWGRRCRGSNKYFKRYRSPTAWGIAARDLSHPLVRSIMADPDALLSAEGTRILKDSRTATVAELTLPVGGVPTPVIFKRFHVKKALDPWLSIVRPSRGWRAWQAAQHFVSRALPTPRNLLYIARRGAGFPWWPASHLPRASYLLTIRSTPSITLADYVRDVLPGLPADRRRDRIAALTIALAHLIRTMHERSISDRDLKAANILIEGDPDAPEPRLSVIDLVGVQLQHPLPRNRRVQNLARLSLSLHDVVGRTRGDTLRFLKLYLVTVLLPREPWKRLWRDVEAVARTKISRNDRHGRRLS